MSSLLIIFLQAGYAVNRYTKVEPILMRLILLQTGKTSEKNLSDGIQNYSDRIKKYIGFEIQTIPDIKNARNMTAREQKIREGEKIIKAVDKRNDFIVLLDEKGREFRTTELAGWLEKRLMLPGKRIVFIIGGAWGFSDEVYEIADMKISLSKMTFPHQLVRLLFVEQLYRVFTVIKGEPYHHE